MPRTAAMNPRVSDDRRTWTPSAAMLAAASLGVVVGLCTMLVLGVYTFEATTEPERGWKPLSMATIVASSCTVGILASFACLSRIARAIRK